MKNDGKHFEKKTHAVLSRLNPTKQVSPNVHIQGKLSQESRELDVVLHDPGDYDFIAFECKDEARVTGLPTIEAYNTKLKDVGAKHGAIVSNMSYSRGARRMAAKLKIDLLNLIDTDDPTIKTRLMSTTAHVRQIVKTWSVRFKADPSIVLPIQGLDLSTLIVQQADGNRKVVKELANDEWNKLADKALHDGQKSSIGIGELLLVVNGQLIPIIEMVLSFDIGVLIKKGALDITNTEGIYDVQNHSYQTNHIMVGSFTAELLDSWQVISEEGLKNTKLSAILYSRTDLNQSHSI